MKIDKLLKYILFFSPTIVIFLFLLYFSDLNTIKETLVQIPLWAYVFILLLSAVSWVIRGERWKVFLKLNHVNIKLIPATVLAAFGNFANWVAPARIGDLAWAYLAKKILKTKFHVTLITIILNRFLDFLSLVILLQLAFFYSSKDMLVEWAGVLNLSSISILIAFVVSLLIFLDGRLLLKIARGPLKKLKKLYLVIRESLLKSTRSKEVFFIWTLASVLIWLIETAMAYILFVSIGLNINFFFILLAIIIGNLTKTVGISPGGTGTYEAAMALILMALTNLDYSVLLTLAIVDHILKKVLVLVLGIITMNYYGVKLFSKEKKKDLH